MSPTAAGDSDDAAMTLLGVDPTSPTFRHAAPCSRVYGPCLVAALWGGTVPPSLTSPVPGPLRWLRAGLSDQQAYAATAAIEQGNVSTNGHGWRPLHQGVGQTPLVTDHGVGMPKLRAALLGLADSPAGRAPGRRVP
ncbi:MAG: hypothetical protein M3Y17_03005 [Actinomycetota bacterium]|nr:hypothetical protein [Actinomycetota bacterium]